jgi:hypothetical protein
MNEIRNSNQDPDKKYSNIYKKFNKEIEVLKIKTRENDENEKLKKIK